HDGFEQRIARKVIAIDRLRWLGCLFEGHRDGPMVGPGGSQVLSAREDRFPRDELAVLFPGVDAEPLPQGTENRRGFLERARRDVLSAAHPSSRCFAIEWAFSSFDPNGATAKYSTSI